MANLYGVANAPTLALGNQYLSGNATIPAGVMTGFYTSPPLIAPSPGYFYPAVWITLVLDQGAAISTGINLGLQIGSGSFTTICTMPGNGWVANGTTYDTMFGVGATSQVAWQGAGSTITLGLSSSTNGVSIWQFSPILIILMRAPDQ